jgi:hypothetical protein
LEKKADTNFTDRSSAICNCISSGSRFSAIEFEPEAGALAGLGFETNAAAHAFETFPDEGKTDASAWIGIMRMEALEEPKDFLMVL